MKLLKFIGILLLLMMMMCSCERKNYEADVYTRIFKKYNDLKSYQCIAEVTVTSNKTTKVYTMKQHYKAPDCYRVEILSPEEIKGLVTVYADNNVTTVHPEIEGKFTLLDYSPVHESYIFLPNFFEAYYKSEQTSVTTINEEDDSRYTILKADIPGNNLYRFSQSIWIDNQSLLPVKMEIYDISNKPTVSVLFYDVELDVEIKDELFKVN
ncbi:MAG: outer membrane lipoprotein carrier protein LolA [Clostridiaceae bacterium]|nr:outer membrane lipoprotein carrier protein LolA [Clostridiaceae bacterium]